MSYRMFLLLKSHEIELPVLPEKLEVSSAGRNESMTVLGLGEINKIQGKGLKEVTIESLFPAHSAPYITGRKWREPMEYIRAIQAHRDTGSPARLLIYGTDLDININVGIEELTYEERAGEVGDLYYSLKLKEWKAYSAKRLLFPLKKTAAATISPPKRPGSPAAAKTHTVVKGESMWAICKKRYGDGSKYPQLYAKNKELIDKRNKGTGLPKYTIYPGQVLKL